MAEQAQTEMVATFYNHLGNQNRPREAKSLLHLIIY